MSAALLLCCAVLAYQLEHDELLEVDSKIVNDIIDSGLKLGTSVPALDFKHTDEGRLTIGVTMHDPKEFLDGNN